jgi:hypothetical protein
MIAKAKANVVGATDYIGNSDGASKAPRPGMDEWIRQAIKHSGGTLWNNGSWGQRDMRGKPGTLSVHATGRAVDLSYRKTDKHPNANRKTGLAFIDVVTAHANALGLQCILDYIAPHGRGWRCDRMAWETYTKETIHGVPGDWFHIEITPKFADDPERVKASFLAVFG